MSWMLPAVLLGLVGLVLAAPAGAASARNGAAACTAGTWLDPATGATRPHDAVLAEAAARSVVLLGETHDNPEHHRWQLSVLAGLLARRPDLVIGFEAFPAEVQPVLDRWVKGELGPQDFLVQVDWKRNWGFDPALYLPLFELARLHRIPMAALNVDRAFVSRVGREGWAAIPRAERHGLGDPVQPSTAYLARLARSFAQHAREAGGAAPTDPRNDPAFRRFVDAQLTWDRAMAEGLARAHGRNGAPLAVGIVGSEHARQRHGVPHQLEDLGVGDTAVLLPQDLTEGCEELAPDEADAVFVVAAVPAAEAPRPRLGVRLEANGDAVSAAEVLPGSVAAASGLLRGDVFVQAAGTPIRAASDLVEIVRSVAPGTWLPLVVRRDGRSIEAVAKFPPAAEADR
ncbi:ChaN family lipoprotein [Benzoatithermus flavus]|uniref:ChaN family lipoprotein n=1 Tax=Benzoatithermus flavus TaxID=3108223 RepID=A0ABU8XU75_9PROT